MNLQNECPYCGSTHKGMCVRVKSVEYNPDGTIKRVELRNPYDFPAINMPPMPEPPWKITCEAP